MADPRAAASQALPQRPYLRPWYRIVEDGDRLLLEYGHSVVTLEGSSVRALLPALLPLLDGTRTLDQFAAALGPPVRPAIEHALEILASKQLLTDGPPVSDDASADARETAELLAALAPASTPAAAAEAVAAAAVAVVGAGRPVEETSRLLLSAGVRALSRLDWSDPAPADADLVLAVPSPDELPRLDEWNQAMLHGRTPWLQSLPFDGRMLAVGPLFLPGEGPCHRCFLLRRAATSNYRGEFWILQQAPAPYPSPGSLASIAAGIAALMALRWLGWRDPLIPGRLVALELGPALEVTTHHVYRVPRCPACSGLAGLAPPLPWFKEDAVAAG